MNRRVLHSATVSLLIALLLSVTVATAGGLLRLRPNEGEVYRYEMVTKQDMDMNLGPMGNQVMETTMTMTTSQTIREVRDDGSVLVDVEYEAVKMKIATPEGEAGDVPDLEQFFLGHVFQIEYSDRGEVLSVSGFSALFDDLVTSAAEGAPQLEGLLGQTFSDDAMKLMLQQLMPVFPEAPPAVGFNWTREAEMVNPIVGTLKMSTTYGHKGIERHAGRKCARLDLTVAVEVPEEIPLVKQLAEMMKAQGLKMDMSMSMDDIEGTGSIWTDRKSGMLVESVMNQRLDIDMSMTMTSTAEDAPPPTKMDLTIVLDQEIRTKLLE